VDGVQQAEPARGNQGFAATPQQLQMKLMPRWTLSPN